MLTVYLDSQDFAHLYRDDISPELINVKNCLLAYKRNNLIKFPISFLTLFEFIQDYQTEFETDRQKRADFLSQLCGTDTLPHFMDIAIENNEIDENSWLPHGAIDNFSVAHLLSVLRFAIKTRPGIPRDLRRDLQSPLVLRNYLRKYFHGRISNIESATKWNSELIDLDFDFDFFRDCLLDKLTEVEANKRFRDSVFEPAKFFEIWYKRFSNKNALNQFYGGMVESFWKLCVHLYIAVPELRSEFEQSRRNAIALNLEIAQLNSQIVSLGILPPIEPATIPAAQDWNAFFENIVPNEKLEQLIPSLQMVFHHYLRAISVQQFKPKKSDIIDIFHSIYLERVDLWRTDRSFANFLSRIEGFSTAKIVPSLLELPTRIEKIFRTNSNLLESFTPPASAAAP